MTIEISKDFIKDNDVPSSCDLKLKIDFTISEILDHFNIKTMGCAVFFVNGKEEKKDYILKNSDRLRILPIFGGG